MKLLVSLLLQELVNVLKSSLHSQGPVSGEDSYQTHVTMWKAWADNAEIRIWRHFHWSAFSESRDKFHLEWKLPECIEFLEFWRSTSVNTSFENCLEFVFSKTILQDMFCPTFLVVSCPCCLCSVRSSLFFSSDLDQALGYKLLVYISCSLAGRAYPVGDIPGDIVSAVKSEVRSLISCAPCQELHCVSSLSCWYHSHYHYQPPPPSSALPPSL